MFTIFIEIKNGSNFGMQDCTETIYGRTAELAYYAATSWASGVVYVLASQGVRLMTPGVPAFDGWRWWQHDGDFTIKLLNKEGGIIATVADVK